jgi:2,3-bisphosphoglycerate-independent phosphoglycerate mutase
MATQRGAKKVYLHLFTDGRDVAPKSALGYIEKTEALFKELGAGRTASVVGRYFAMDRDNRWERVSQAYDLITAGQANFTANSATQAVEMAYARGETDEFIQATAILEDGKVVHIESGDALLFMNYRADRARQLTECFISEHFKGFQREFLPHLSHFVCLTQYNANFEAEVAYPPMELKNTFGEYVSNLGLKQLRIAETEKYAHVTFFLNGGKEEPFLGEDRILIPSPKVATYDLQPEMSVAEIADALVEAIASGKYDTFICNFANPDMVGHSGDLKATTLAIEAVDKALGRVMEAIEKAGGELLVTADHGNAEMLMNPETGQPHTAHTTNPVPFIYFGNRSVKAMAESEQGALPDVLPTLLTLMGLEIPAEMTGKSLVTLG